MIPASTQQLPGSEWIAPKDNAFGALASGFATMLQSKQAKMEEDQKARNNMLTQMFPSLIAQHMLAPAGTQGGAPLSTPVGDFSMVQPPTDYSKLNDQVKYEKETNPQAIMLDTILKTIGQSGSSSMSTMNMMGAMNPENNKDQSVILENMQKNMQWAIQNIGSKTSTTSAKTPAKGSSPIEGAGMVKVRHKRTGKEMIVTADGFKQAADQAEWDIIQ
jgi:hypothetical protein